MTTGVMEQNLTTLELQLSTYHDQIQEFREVTAEKLERAALFIGGCKAAEKWIDEDRVKKVKPLNDEVTSINDAHNKVKNGFASVRVTVEMAVSTFRTKQKRIADEQQRLALEEAARIQREKDEALRLEREALAKAEEEARIKREQAELEESNIDLKIERAERELTALQEAMPENLSVAQLRQLRTKEERVLALRAEKVALEPVVIDTSAADAQRERIATLEAEAAVPVVAQVVEQVEKTIKTGAGSITFKDDKTTWILPGWDQKKKKASIDVVEAGLLDMLPAEIRWLLKVSILDIPALNQSHKNREKFPKPFGEVSVFGGSTVRNGKA